MAGSSKNSNDWNENSNGCSYQDFIYCGAYEFDGEVGALGFLTWRFKMDMVVRLSECTEGQTGEYVTRMLTGRAFKWWKTLRTELGQTAAARIVWNDLKVLMESEFYPNSEKQRMEQELTGLRMLGNDYATYSRRFQDLCILVPHMVNTESKRIEQFIRGLDPQLQEMARAVYPHTMRNVLNRVEWLADDVLSQAPSRKDCKDRDQPGHYGGKSRGDKRSRTRKTYGGPYPECLLCGLHHPSTIPCSTCHRCNRLGHFARHCQEKTRLAAPVRVQDPTVNKRACCECGSQSHHQKACLEPDYASGQDQRTDSGPSPGWTYVTGTDGERHAIPILGRCGEYAKDSTTE